MATFIVVYDACVLHPAALRDLLIRLAAEGLVQAKWTEDILDEVFGSILRRKPDLDSERLARTRRLMNAAVPDCLVTGHEGLADHIELPDPDDRHVLAAAIRSGAQGIVTANLRDLPPSVLAPLGIETLHPDRFVLDLLDLRQGVVLKCLLEQLQALRRPPVTLVELLSRLEENGLMRSMAEVRRLQGLGG